MNDSRRCAYCGEVFTPRREHSRFCSAECRVAWHRTETGDPDSGFRALQWSVPGMSSAIRVLAAVDGLDRAAAFAAIGDAVWAVTIVDAALVRYHPGAYDELLGSEAPPDRELIERTLAGVRFVRNQIAGEADLASFVEPSTADSVVGSGVMVWTWKPMPQPELTGHTPRARAWATARYQAYESALANHTVAEIFARAEDFLLRAAAAAGLTPDVDAASARLLRAVREDV